MELNSVNFLYFAQEYITYLNVLSAANASASDRKYLLSELELMKKLKPHPHVIKLMGCVTEGGNAKCFFNIFYGACMDT